jgi:nucleoside-diphosphate-sugar epimerase
MPLKRRVLITGAAGRIGVTVTERLAERWDVVATDVAGSGCRELDVTDAASCRAPFDGVDAVVHLAAVPDPEAHWDQLLPANVIGVHSVASAAVALRTRRLVLASSLQAVSADPADLQVRADDPPRPANLYGATKAWAEAIGSWVTATSPVEVVAMRIGYFAEEPPSGPDVTPCDLAAWLSPDDCAELVRAAVEGQVAGFTVVNGVSANRYRKATHGPAEQRIGFRPSDDAWASSSTKAIR